MCSKEACVLHLRCSESADSQNEMLAEEHISLSLAATPLVYAHAELEQEPGYDENLNPSCIVVIE